MTSHPHDDAIALVAAGKHAEARERFLSLLEEAGDDHGLRLNALCYLGIAAGRLGHFEEAVEALMTALDLAPSSGRIAEQLGEVHMERGHEALESGGPASVHFNESLNYYRRARAMSPRPDIDYNIACMASRLGRHDEMLEALTRAIAADPSQRDDARQDPDLQCSLHVEALADLLK